MQSQRKSPRELLEEEFERTGFDPHAAHLMVVSKSREEARGILRQNPEALEFGGNLQEDKEVVLECVRTHCRQNGADLSGTNHRSYAENTKT